MASDRRKRYDVFLSHNGADKPFVKDLAQKLRDAGLRPFLDVWHLRPGDPWQEGLEEAIDQSATCAVFLGPSGLGPWQNEEMRVALAERVRHRAFRVIPVLIPDARMPGEQELPRFLNRLTWVDFRDPDQKPLKRLVWGITGKRQGCENPDPTPKPWNVPYRRNPYFAGREDILLALRQALTKKRSAALGQAISGLGGIGKTQTAVEYAYLYRDDYEAVLWARAETEAELAAGYVEIAQVLDLELKDAQEQEVVIAAVRRWLEGHRGWLLVLDNADTPNVVEPFLPKESKGHVLVTSRARVFDVLGMRKPLRLATLPPDEALKFLLERTERQDAGAEEQAAAKEIAEELGYLPLALEQAGALMSANETLFSGYLRSFRSHPLKLLEKGKPSATEYTTSVAKTWVLNFEKIETTSTAAAELLRLSAFLAPDYIPVELLIEGVEELGAPLRDALADVSKDPVVLDELLTALNRYSLIERDTDIRAFSVHRMVQAVIRDAMDEDEKCRWARRSVKALNRVYPEVEFAHWARCDRFQAHVRLAAETVATFSLGFEEAGLLLSRAGSYARARARYSEAEPLLESATAIIDQALGPSDPALATSLTDLANLYRDQGRYKDAEPVYMRSVTILEEALGSDHTELATSLQDQALLYREQGRYEEAKPLFQRSVEIHEQALRQDPPSLATSLHNLALLYSDLGQFEEAEPLYHQALQIKEQALGPHHPALATTLTDLASLYRDQGRDKEAEKAEPLYQRALEIFAQTLGPDHPEIAKNLNDLALLYNDRKRYGDAEPLFQRSLAIKEKALGSEHPSLATTVNDLALLYYNQGRYQEAEPLFTRSLAIKEQALGSDHPSIATGLNNLADLCREQGRYKEAEPLYRHSLRITEQTLGENHPLLAVRLKSLADLYRKQGRDKDAAPLYRRELAIMEQVLGKSHPDLAKHSGRLHPLQAAERPERIE